MCDEKAQRILGDKVAARFAELNPQASEKQIEHESTQFQRAPLLIVMLFTPKEGRIPLWEQQLSAGAAGMNLLHAAEALGYAGQWLTEWPCFDETINAWLKCQAPDCIAGFFYIGSSATPPEERKDRERPKLEEIAFTLESWLN